MTRRDLLAGGFGAAMAPASGARTPEELKLKPLEFLDFDGFRVSTARPPGGLRFETRLGLLLHERVQAQHIYAEPTGFAEAPRIVVTPGGDYFTAFPAGSGHQWGKTTKVNEMVAYRSADKGKTWKGPVHPWKVPYNQHAFNPLIPRGSKRIYTFGLEPPFETMSATRLHSGPLAMRWSDDDGRTWSEPRPIRPTNAPDYAGVCHMQMCETGRGTWLLGTYTVTNIPQGTGQSRADRQHVLRSTDRGETWQLIPGPKHGGWHVQPYDRLLEGEILSLGGVRAVMFARVPSGRIWELRTEDDGLNWSEPKPTSMVHPDAPPMVFHVGRGVLASFIHNRPGGADRYDRARDRRDLWCCLSSDEGRSWSEPRWVLSDASEPVGWSEVSYADLLVDGDRLHLLFDHQKRYVVHAAMRRRDLERLPTLAELGAVAKRGR